MVHLSLAAATEIKRLSSKQHQPNMFFRLQVKDGGCSGLFYDMTFAETVNLGDRVYDSKGIQVVVDTESLNYLNGLTLDYSEDLMGGGFRFHNPQAKASCGCGNSFSTTSDSP